MLPEERKQRILEYVSKYDFADVPALVKILHVSPATVRRDLQELSDRGLITRTRGGASLASKGVGHEPPFQIRSKENQAEKLAIAQFALNYVREGEVIGIDVGSSTLEMARLMRDHQKITVFSASLLVADILSKSEINIILVGGMVRKREMSVAGPIAAQIINQFYFDKFFLGIAGVTESDGFTDFSIDDVEVKKNFLAHSKEVIALADHTKLGRVSLTRICPLSTVNRLITDQKADPTQVEALKQAGLEVIIAEAI